MPTAIALDDELLAKADFYAGIRGKSALVCEALKAMCEREAARRLIERQILFGRGIGYGDAHLLAAARLTGSPLWPHDRRLQTSIAGLGLAARLPR